MRKFCNHFWSLLFFFSYLAIFSHFASADIKVVVHPTTFKTWMVNAGNDVIESDGWELYSELGYLAPSSWKGLVDYMAANSENIEIAKSLFGNSVIGFQKSSAKPTSLSEINTSGVAIWQSGQTFPIGYPFGFKGRALEAKGGDALFVYSVLEKNISTVKEGKISFASCADLDFDGDTDSADMLVFLSYWTGSLEGDSGDREFVEGDCDSDSDVDSADLLSFLDQWTGAE